VSAMVAGSISFASPVDQSVRVVYHSRKGLARNGQTEA
jgi:hypothetical protein